MNHGLLDYYGLDDFEEDGEEGEEGEEEPRGRFSVSSNRDSMADDHEETFAQSNPKPRSSKHPKH